MSMIDGVFMAVEAFERRKQLLDLRAKILRAEEERLGGAKRLTIAEARERLSGL